MCGRGRIRGRVDENRQIGTANFPVGKMAKGEAAKRKLDRKTGDQDFTVYKSGNLSSSLSSTSDGEDEVEGYYEPRGMTRQSTSTHFDNDNPILKNVQEIIKRAEEKEHWRQRAIVESVEKKIFSRQLRCQGKWMEKLGVIEQDSILSWDLANTKIKRVLSKKMG